MAYVKTYKVVPTRDAFEVTQGSTGTVVARCASRVRANRVKDELNGCDVLLEVISLQSKDAINVYLQTAHLQATNMRGEAIREGTTKAKWHYEGKREAIEEILKEVNK